MSGVLPPGFALLLVSIAIAVVGQVLFKLGAARFSLSPAGLAAQITNVPLMLGFTAYFLSAVLYVAALQTVPLSVAYPTLALGYIVVIAISVLGLGEHLSPVQALGGALVCLGVILLWR